MAGVVGCLRVRLISKGAVAMLMKVLGLVVLSSVLMLVSAAAPAAPRGNPVTTDIAEHPEILMTDFNPANLALYGAHVGDPTSKVQADKIDRFSGTLPGLIKLAGYYQVRYNPTTYTVTALVLTDHQTLVKIGLADRYDAEFKFGVPDIQNDRHGIYLKKRVLCNYDNNNLVSVEIR
jgi:hypothetical protein